VGLRDRIVADRARGEDGAGDGVGYYRRRLLEEVDLSEIAVLSEEQRRARLERVVGRMVSREGPVLSTAERSRLIRRVVDEAVGLGVLEPLLADDSVTEIMVNGTDEIYVERDGRIERADIAFSDEAQLFQTIDRIVSTVNRRVDESSPMVDARLPTGERVNVIIPPLALRGPTMTIRRFPRLFTIDELVEREQTREAADRQRRALQRQRRDDHVHALAGGQAGVDHRARLVDAPADPGHDAVDDPAQVVLVGELGVDHV
jgi:pilus assembly protein CpaF